MILFLAVNGIAEAYAHAVMSPNELASANMVLLVSQYQLGVFEFAALIHIHVFFADHFGV
jgi:hypothetical protein